MRRYRRICRVIPPVIGAGRPQNTNLFSSHDHNDDHDRRDLIQNPMQACYVDDVLVPEQQFAGAKLSPTFSLFCQVTQVPFYHHH